LQQATKLSTKYADNDEKFISRNTTVSVQLALEGSTLRPDNDANKKLYGKEMSASDIVLKGEIKSPPSAKELLATLNKKSPKNKS
jgi:lipid-binding SYLF domain-containing protein